VSVREHRRDAPPPPNKRSLPGGVTAVKRTSSAQRRAALIRAARRRRRRRARWTRRRRSRLYLHPLRPRPAVIQPTSRVGPSETDRARPSLGGVVVTIHLHAAPAPTRRPRLTCAAEIATIAGAIASSVAAVVAVITLVVLLGGSPAACPPAANVCVITQGSHAPISLTDPWLAPSPRQTGSAGNPLGEQAAVMRSGAAKCLLLGQRGHLPRPESCLAPSPRRRRTRDRGGVPVSR
jgi:hypothetical protein